MHKYGKIDLGDLNWQKRKYDTNRAYGDSKLANLYFLNGLKRRFEKETNAPTVVAAHPGATRTELQRHVPFVKFINGFLSQDVEQGVLPTLRAGFDPDVVSGDFYGPSGLFELKGAPVKVATSERAKNQAVEEKLWYLSEQLTGVEFN